MPPMRPICDILDSSPLAAPVAEGERLLFLRRTAKRTLAALGADIPCEVAAATNGVLELRAQNAAAATKLKQMLPSFLAAFNREAKTNLRAAHVRVAPEQSA